MAKMTLLHFASPFAFSMPLPVRQPASGARSGTSGHDAADVLPSTDDEQASLPTGADRISQLVMDGPANPIADASSTRSIIDTVMQRYGEQQSQHTGLEDQAFEAANEEHEPSS